jgi:hypothetical protein
MTPSRKIHTKPQKNPQETIKKLSKNTKKSKKNIEKRSKNPYKTSLIRLDYAR